MSVKHSKKLILISLFAPVLAMAELPFVDLSTVPDPAIGSPDYRVRIASQAPPYAPNAAKIRPQCTFAKAGNFDPIVYPGQAMAGHHHTFFGNVAVTGESTGEQLNREGNSTCAGGTAIRSSAWVPSMIDGRTGRFLKPWRNQIYYLSGYGVNAQTLTQAMPAGMKMLTGDRANKNPHGYYQALNKISFECFTIAGEDQHYSTKILNCAPGHFLRMNVAFPNCWNGRDLDSADHKSHMAFARTGDWQNHKNECPTGYPVRVWDVAYKIDWQVKAGDNASNWLLASDDVNTDCHGCTSHGDYIAGVETKVKKLMTANCLQSAHDCLGYMLGKDPADGLLKALY